MRKKSGVTWLVVTDHKEAGESIGVLWVVKQFSGHCCVQFNELQAVGLFLGLDGASTSIQHFL